MYFHAEHDCMVNHNFKFRGRCMVVWRGILTFAKPSLVGCVWGGRSWGQWRCINIVVVWGGGVQRRYRRWSFVQFILSSLGGFHEKWLCTELILLGSIKTTKIWDAANLKLWKSLWIINYWSIFFNLIHFMNFV